MKLTSASSYAIHALAYMAEHPTDRPVASHAIARARGIPERFLLKILKPLATYRILMSMKGPNGGYRLARPANKITLLDIVEAVDGPLRGGAPTTENAEAGPLTQKLEAIAQRVTDDTRKLLKAVTLAQLMTKVAKAK